MSDNAGPGGPQQPAQVDHSNHTAPAKNISQEAWGMRTWLKLRNGKVATEEPPQAQKVPKLGMPLKCMYGLIPKGD